MFHIVYLTTNLANNKIYVGVHSTYNLDDGYLGSGYALKHAIKKYGRHNFKRQILHYCLSEEQSLEFESKIVDLSFVERNDTYNIKLAGGNKVSHTIAIRNKISLKKKGLKHTEEQNTKQSERMKINNPFKDKKHSDTTRKVISEKTKQYMNSKSPEEISAIIEHMATFNRGKKRTKEFCEQRSFYRKLQHPPKSKTYKLISPTMDEYVVNDGLVNFCNIHNLSISLLRRFINKGKIFGKQTKQSLTAKNTMDWEIQLL